MIEKLTLCLLKQSNCSLFFFKLSQFPKIRKTFKSKTRTVKKTRPLYLISASSIFYMMVSFQSKFSWCIIYDYHLNLGIFRCKSWSRFQNSRQKSHAFLKFGVQVCFKYKVKCGKYGIQNSRDEKVGRIYLFLHVLHVLQANRVMRLTFRRPLSL